MSESTHTLVYWRKRQTKYDKEFVMANTKSKNTGTVGRTTYGPLFSTVTEVVLFGIEEMAEFYSRLLIADIEKARQIDNPNKKYLIDNAKDYIQSIAVSAIVINPTSENPLNIRGYAHHILTLLNCQSIFHTAMNIIGEVKYQGHGVRRVTSYKLGKNFKLMPVDEAKNYSSELKDFLSGEGLVQGIPHNDLGDLDAMSLTLVGEMKNEEAITAEKLCSFMDKDMPDREYMASLFPRLDKQSGRIPPVVNFGEGEDLRYTLRSLR